VLHNQYTGKLYPVRWQTDTGALLAELPAITTVTGNPVSSAGAVKNCARSHQSLEQPGQPLDKVVLSHFKLKLALLVPTYHPQTGAGEPVIQWSDQHTVPLIQFRQALVERLKPLAPATTDYLFTVEGLTTTAAAAALRQLTGVIVGCPVDASAAFRFNLREAILETGLVAAADQIFFLEDAIAALLAELNRQACEGSTLVISAGASTTELLLTQVPSNPARLMRRDLFFRRIAYGGDGINQDILCQILHPHTGGWKRLELNNLDHPLPGEPDQAVRDRLQQRLRSSRLGESLLRAIEKLKLTLQEQTTLSLHLHDQLWTVTQQEFHNRVVLPYLQRLNRELNNLLSQSGIAPQAVRQVICSGGTTQLPALLHWLQQKLPAAQLIQDRSAVQSDHIAMGLALLPGSPQMLDLAEHQYGDWFLLHKLLQMAIDQPLSLGRILQSLEQEGIPPRSCQERIVRILEGQLPTGLIPSQENRHLLTPASRQYYGQVLPPGLLFSRQSNRLYSGVVETRDRLRQYLERITSQSHQSLSQPLTHDLSSPVSL